MKEVAKRRLRLIDNEDNRDSVVPKNQ